MSEPIIDRSPVLCDFADTKPTTFERDRRGFTGAFEVYADRKDAAYVMLASGLSHKGGRVQHMMSPDAAEALGRALLNAAAFARNAMLADK